MFGALRCPTERPIRPRRKAPKLDHRNVHAFAAFRNCRTDNPVEGGTRNNQLSVFGRYFVKIKGGFLVRVANNGSIAEPRNKFLSPNLRDSSIPELPSKQNRRMVS